MVLAEDLRQAVLQAALQGKLTKQLETDSDVDEMLINIQEDRESKISNNIIKKDKRLFMNIIEEEDVPFPVPTNWRWTTLGSIVYKLTDGTHKTPKYTVDGIKFISVKDISSGKLNLSATKYISQEEHNELYRRCNPEKGDMLLSKIGTTGVPAIVDTDEQFSLFVSVALLKYCRQFINEKFLYFLLLSSLVQEQAKENTRGVGNKNWVLDFIAKTVIPLPPIEEQQRIVDKINMIMPKIDEYEKIEKELETLKKEFPINMKDALLHAAMQGKLTEQLESDSSVDELLEAVRKEKDELIVQKKIKKEKLLPDIEEEEIPFDIPANWRWVRMGNVIKLTSGQDLQSDKYSENNIGIPYLTGASNFQEGKLLVNRYTSNGTSFAFHGDLLLTCKGTIGEMAFMSIEKAHIARQIMSISAIDDINLAYIKLCLDNFLLKLKANARSIIPGIERKVILNLPIPIPSIEEQQRIVEKLDALLPLCEDLKEE